MVRYSPIIYPILSVDDAIGEFPQCTFCICYFLKNDKVNGGGIRNRGLIPMVTEEKFYKDKCVNSKSLCVILQCNYSVSNYIHVICTVYEYL